MSWKRDIPFGYRMERSQIAIDEKEADTVKQIFSLYLSGESLKRISEQMEASGLRYHADTCIWNKNMVKRILENGRYIGDESYPRIIDPKDFIAVRTKGSERQQELAPRPESLQHVGKKVVCAACGARMYRNTKKNVRTRWICQNENCRETLIIADDDLREALDRCLVKIALSPALLEPCTADDPEMNTGIMRISNELTAAFNRGTETPEYIRSLIFALASERYNAMPDMCLIHTLKELQTRIAAEGITEDNRREIEQTAIRRVLLGRESGVSIELINGKIISDKEEVKK